jgi:hypothetical protein
MALASRRQTVEWVNDKSGHFNPNFNGGRYLDDKGYIRILMPDHPYHNHGYVYEHRLVMEEYLGRYLQSWETVHHINEVKIDNRIENFFLTTVPEHSAVHREGKKKTPKAKSELREHAKRRAREDKIAGGPGLFTKRKAVLQSNNSDEEEYETH